MSFITVRPEEPTRCVTTQKNVIGVSGDTSLRITGVTTDANCIYVDCINGSDANAGTSAAPKETLSGAFTAIINTGITTQNYIQIENDTYPYEIETERIPANSGSTKLRIQAGSGVTPQVYGKCSSSSPELSVTTSGVGIFPYYASVAPLGTSIYYTEYDGSTGYDLMKWDGTTKVTVVDRGTGVTTAEWTTVWDGIQKVWIYDTVTGEYDDTDFCAVYGYRNNNEGFGIYKEAIGGNEFYNDDPIGWVPGVDPKIIANSLIGADSGANKICPAFAKYDSRPTGIYLRNRTNESFYLLQVNGTNLITGKKNRQLLYCSYANAMPFNYWFVDSVDIPEVYDMKQFYGKVYIACDAGIYYVDFNSSTSMNRGKDLTYYILETIDAKNIRSLKPYYYNRGLPLDGRDRLYAGCENGDIYEYNPNTSEWQFYVNIGVSVDEIEAIHVFGLYKVMYIRSGGSLYRIDMNNNTYDVQMLSGVDRIIYWNYGLDNKLQGFYYVSGYNIYKKYEEMVIVNPVEFNGIKFEPDDKQHSGFRQIGLSTSDIIEYNWCDINTDYSKIYAYEPSAHYYTFIQNCNLSNSMYGVCLLSGTEDWESAQTSRLILKLKNNNIWNIEEFGIIGHFYGNYNNTLILPLVDCGISNNNFFNIKNAIIFSNSFVGASQLHVNNNTFLQIAECNVKSISNQATLKSNISYLSNRGFENCIDILDYPTTYNHPLFIDLRESNENFKLLAECEGSLVSSPAIITPYIDSSGNKVNDYVYWDNVNLFDESGDSIDLLDKELYKVKIEYSTVTAHPSTPTMYFQGSSDGVGWTTLISKDNTVFSSGVSVDVNPYYRYFKIKVNESQWNDVKVILYFRDIGASDVERTEINTTPADIVIQYPPEKTTVGRIKAESQNVYNFDGYPAILSRSRQVTRYRFDWNLESSMTSYEDIHNIMLLHGLNKYILKIYFDDKSNYTGNCNLLSKKLTDSGNELARIYLDSCGYNIYENYITITHTESYVWKINQWLGWHVTITGKGEYNNTYKIIYNDTNTLWLELTVANEVTTISKTFNIEYFRGIINSTSIEYSEYFNEITPDLMDSDPRISTIEIMEA